MNPGCKCSLQYHSEKTETIYVISGILNIHIDGIEKEYLNGDGVIDLIDFSIMAYYWTG